MEAFEAYSHALASLAGFSLLMMVLGAVSTVGRSPENRTQSGAVIRNYSDPTYRRGRAFANAMESAAPFIGATLAAILVGANPFWVNLFASLFLAARIAVAVVHIGTEIQWLRSAIWTVGTVCILVLGVMGIWGAF